MTIVPTPDPADRPPPGMSRGAKGTLGVLALIVGVCFVPVAFTLPDTRGQVGCLGVATFCILIGAACLSTTIRPFAVRAIAAVVLSAAVWYCISMFTGGPATSGQRSQPSMWNAVMFAMVFGLPALYVLVTGTYPRWGSTVQSSAASNQLSPMNTNQMRSARRPSDIATGHGICERPLVRC